MNNKKKTFIFIYGDLCVGGIELYLLRLIRKLKKNNYRIIWLTSFNVIIDETLMSDFCDPYIERKEISLNDIYSIRTIKLDFEHGEKVYALAFNPITFLQLESIKKKYKHAIINNFYFVSHFQGIFLEDLIKIKLLNYIMNKIFGKMIRKMEKNDNIIYVTNKHVEAFQKKYNYKAVFANWKFVNSTKDFEPFSVELSKERSRRNKFNIISVGRFDFPHKSYILGLIDTFVIMKKKYNQLFLTIVGYGKDEKIVKDKINNLDYNVKKDIELVNKVKYDDLKHYFNQSHLNVGVASTISDGALTGLISIPVRHYSSKCEGYGYLPESRNFTVSTDPGTPIELFIEELIMMDDAKYIEYSWKSYNAFAKIDNDILSFMDFGNKDPKKSISNIYLLIFGIIKKIRNIFK